MELNQGTQLQNGKYRILDTIMQDDTVICYRAMYKMVVDGPYGKFKTDIEVILKEFFLRNYCSRNQDGAVVIVDKDKCELIENSKQNFKAMAQNLASMSKSDGSAQVTDIFEENDTIYYVSPIKEGQAPIRSEDNVQVMPPQVRQQPERTFDLTPTEANYGYDQENKSKKKIWLFAAIGLALIATVVALFMLLGNHGNGDDNSVVADTTQVNSGETIDSATNSAREQVAKDVAEINKNLPNALNDHIIMKTATYDKESNVLSITYDVTDMTDLAKQKEDIRTGMLSGLKSNDGTGRHFREALITVKEFFKMNGTTIDQFVLTPEDYSKIKI